jgi:hypothetical protein
MKVWTALEGMLAKQLYRRTGGYPGMLADEKMLGLLEHMNGGTVRKDGSPTDKDVVNQERDLEVGEVKSRLRREVLAGRLHDSLVSMGALVAKLKYFSPGTTTALRFVRRRPGPAGIEWRPYRPRRRC